MGLFYLLTIYFLIRGSVAGASRRWHAVAVVACAFGMASKAVMITTPVATLLYDRIFLTGSGAETLRRRWGLYVGLGATWILPAITGVAGGVLNPQSDQSVTVGFGYEAFTPIEYALTQPGVILHYLRLSLWPTPLCLDYWWPIAKTAGAIAVPGLVIFGLICAAAWSFRWQPWLGFLGAWFFIILAPTSSFIPLQDAAFEHRMYLPLAAVIVVVVGGAYGLLNRLYRALSLKRAAARRISGMLVIVVSVACGYGTVQRNKDYHSNYAMWADVVAKRPGNPRAHTDLGKILAERGQIDAAIRRCELALQLEPNYYIAHSNLGNALAARGRIDEAIPHFREAIRLKNDYAEAYSNLGAALAQSGRIGEAIAQFEQSLEIDPRDLRVRYNLAVALLQEGAPDKAIEQCIEIIRRNPSHRDAIRALAIAFVRTGNIDAAINRFDDRALLDHAYVQAYVLSGDEHRREGRIDEAIKAYRKALSIDPGYAPARSGIEAVRTVPGVSPRVEGEVDSARYRSTEVND
jgi:tetratricopeptide (TPR) repeat protein